MNKKSIFCLASVVTLSVAAVAASGVKANKFLSLGSNTVEWSHYAKVEATYTTPGIREYWVNCSAGEHTFTAPTGDVTVVEKTLTNDQKAAILADKTDDRIIPESLAPDPVVKTGEVTADRVYYYLTSDGSGRREYTQNAEYSFDGENWTTFTAGYVSTKQVYDAQYIYSRPVGYGGQRGEVTSYEIGKKMYLPTTYYISGNSYPFWQNPVNGSSVTLNNYINPAKEIAPGISVTHPATTPYGAKGLSNSQPVTALIGEKTAADYAETNGKMFSNTIKTNAQHEKYPDYLAHMSSDGSISTMFYVSDIAVYYTDGTTEKVDTFYTPELAFTPCRGGNVLIANSGAEVVKEDGYKTNTWYEVKCKLTGWTSGDPSGWGTSGGFRFASLANVRTFTGDASATGSLIGSTFHDKTVEYVRYAVSYNEIQLWY